MDIIDSLKTEKFRTVREPDGKWKEFPIGSVENLYSLKPRILEAVRSADGSSRQGGNP